MVNIYIYNLITSSIHHYMQRILSFWTIILHFGLSSSIHHIQHRPQYSLISFCTANKCHQPWILGRLFVPVHQVSDTNPTSATKCWLIMWYANYLLVNSKALQSTNLSSSSLATGGWLCHVGGLRISFPTMLSYLIYRLNLMGNAVLKHIRCHDSSSPSIP